MNLTDAWAVCEAAIHGVVLHITRNHVRGVQPAALREALRGPLAVAGKGGVDGQAVGLRGGFFSLYVSCHRLLKISSLRTKINLSLQF